MLLTRLEAPRRRGGAGEHAPLSPSRSAHDRERGGLLLLDAQWLARGPLRGRNGSVPRRRLVASPAGGARQCALRHGGADRSLCRSPGPRDGFSRGMLAKRVSAGVGMHGLGAAMPSPMGSHSPCGRRGGLLVAREPVLMLIGCSIGSSRRRSATRRPLESRSQDVKPPTSRRFSSGETRTRTGDTTIFKSCGPRSRTVLKCLQITHCARVVRGDGASQIPFFPRGFGR